MTSGPPPRVWGKRPIMPRNPHKTRCQTPNCRSWAMRGRTHCRTHSDRELGPRNAGAPQSNLNALKDGQHAHPLPSSPRPPDRPRAQRPPPPHRPRPPIPPEPLPRPPHSSPRPLCLPAATSSCLLRLRLRARRKGFGRQRKAGHLQFGAKAGSKAGRTQFAHDQTL